MTETAMKLKVYQPFTPVFTMLTVCILCLLAMPSMAQELKIGYVDTARVLKEAPQAEMARKNLKDEFNPRDEKIVEMQNQLKSLTEQQEKTDRTLSSSARSDLERDILTLKRDIKRAKEEFTEDFNLRRNEELAKLQQIIQKTTFELAKDKSFDVVLSDSVLYTSKRIDITEMLLERLRSAAKDSIQNTNSK
jgi:outer membrane protein